MRTIDLSDVNFSDKRFESICSKLATAQYGDPMMTLESLDDVLKRKGLEVVLVEDGSSDQLFFIGVIKGYHKKRMKKKDKSSRLIMGCRARILTLKEKPKRVGKRFFSNEGHWRKEYGDREVILLERSDDRFSVMLLGKGVKKLKKKDSKTAEGNMAWVPEEDMVLVDRNFEANLDFIDWYQAHENDFCGDCGEWAPDRGKYNPKTKDEVGCPNKDCPSHHLEDYEDEEE